MKKKKKRWAIILTILIFLIFWGGYIHHPQQDLEVLDTFELPQDTILFQTQMWLESGDSLDNTRIYMLKDLTARHLHPGYDTTVIKDLLGEPLYMSKPSNNYFYNVGHDQEGTVYLILELDSLGIYQNYSIKSLDPDGEMLTTSY